MKNLFIILAILAILAMAFTASAADVSMKWLPSTDAMGYKIYISTDLGQTWDAGVAVGNVTTYTYLNVPEDGLILFRISAYSKQGEGIRYWDGVWFNGLMKPPAYPKGYGLE